MSLAIDGTAHFAVVTPATTVFTVGPLTTTGTNDVICLVCSQSGAPILTVLASTGLAFTRRVAAPLTQVGGTIEFWYAVAATPLVAATITVTTGSLPGFVTIDAFGISGADMTNIFDRNSSLPAVTAVDPVIVSASMMHGEIIVFGFFHEHTTPTSTAGPGFIAISGSDHQLVEYAIMTGPQVNLVVDDSTPLDADAVIGDVIVGNFNAVLMSTRVSGVHFSDDISVVSY